MTGAFETPRIKEKELALELAMFVASIAFGESFEELEGTPEQKKKKIFELYNECTGIIGIGSSGAGERSERPARADREDRPRSSSYEDRPRSSSYGDRSERPSRDERPRTSYGAPRGERSGGGKKTFDKPRPSFAPKGGKSRDEALADGYKPRRAVRED